MGKDFFEMYADWHEKKYPDSSFIRGIDNCPNEQKLYKYIIQKDRNLSTLGAFHRINEYYGIFVGKKRVIKAVATRLASLEKELGDDLVNEVVKNMRYLRNAPEETAQSILSAFADIENPEEAWDYMMEATEEYCKRGE